MTHFQRAYLYCCWYHLLCALVSYIVVFSTKKIVIMAIVLTLFRLDYYVILSRQICDWHFSGFYQIIVHAMQRQFLCYIWLYLGIASLDSSVIFLGCMLCTKTPAHIRMSIPSRLKNQSLRHKHIPLHLRKVLMAIIMAWNDCFCWFEYVQLLYRYHLMHL